MLLDAAFLDRIAGLRVVVIGEGMLDRYLKGTTDRLSREAPVPIVALDSIVEAPGAAANVATNIAALGARVSLITTVGNDDAGIALIKHLNEAGVDADYVALDRERQTLIKERVIAGRHMLMRLDRGTTCPVGDASERYMKDALRRLIPNADAVVVSDYAYGILTPGVIDTLRAELQRRNVPLLVDAKDPWLYRDLRPAAVKPNYSEAARLLHQSEETETPARIAQLTEGAESLLGSTGAAMVAVSLDQDGALLLRRGTAPYRVFAHADPDARGAGAGDCFLAALAIALAGKVEPEPAIELATTAAAIGVEREGTAVCKLDRLEEALRSLPGKLIERPQLALRLEELRRAGNRIVFTNGCFDIVHRGHTTFLSQARQLGEVLVVGLNSDRSVRQLKGPARPVNTFADRAEVLAALASVDFVVPFDELVPLELLRLVKPQIFVKGGDYTADSLPEAELVRELGGIVRILDYLPDHSTTGIIEKIGPARPAVGTRL